MNTKRTYISLAIVACVVVVVLIAASVAQRPYPGSAGTAAVENDGTQPAATTTQTAPVSDVPKSSKYKDGTYYAVGNYDSPAGQESVGVSLTLKNGIVTSATVTQMAQDWTSSRYQKKFISGFQPLVIGKRLDSIRLDAVSGSSLTPVGFNAALAKIKAQAAQA